MAPNDLVHYFAYGSNMSRERLAARVAEPVTLGTARLAGMRLACNKPGRDGSGKANIVRDPDSHVWGVVYGLRWVDLDALDGFEPGYAREIHRVLRGDGTPFDAHTYRWLPTDPPLAPAAWYRDLILEGAREHGLPQSAQRAIQEWDTNGEP